MRKLLFVLIVVFSSMVGHAQDEATVSGMIKDATSGENLSFVTVTIGKEDKLIAGTISDENGHFNLAGIPSGDFHVHCSFIGYQAYDSDIHIGVLNSNYDLGTIRLLTSSEELDEVVVKAAKASISSGLDKKTFSMEDNISQSGGSVLEAMKNLPGVTIDHEGKVLLRGSDKVSVLIDGKRSSLTGFGNQKGLDNLSAALIERIEIINNPSAKYDAAGMAGIINIIYKKEKAEGVSGDVGFAFGIGELTERESNLPNIMDKYSLTPKVRPEFSLNYRTKKVNFFVQSEANFRKKVNSNEFSTRTYVDGSGVISQFLENRVQQRYSVKSGLDWYIDDRNSLTIYSLWEDEYHIDRGHVPYDNVTSGERKRFWTWKEDERTYFMNYGVNYEHEFKNPGHKLGIDFLYTKGKEDELFPFTDTSLTRPEGSVDSTHMVSREEVKSLDVDYVRPLRSGRIEFGGKVHLRQIPISYDILPGENSILDPALGSWSKYKEDIYALYLNYIYESSKLEMELGGRVEDSEFTYRLDPENEYYDPSSNLSEFSFFPNIRVTLKPGDNDRFSAFINRRVDRPGEFELRPFPKYDDPEILKTGNPYLKPQFTYNYELAYKHMWDVGSVYVAGFYRDIADLIARVYTSASDDENVLNAIPENLGKSNNVGLEVSFDQNVTSNWDVNGSFTWYENTIDQFSGVHVYPETQEFTFEESKSNTWNCKVNSKWRLNKGYDIQLTGVYYSKDIIPQGEVKARYSVDFGIKKHWMEDRLETALSGTDLFNTFDIKENISTPYLSLTRHNFFESQVFKFSIKYKF
ncbi:TonB-dependent receptor [Puteibacter caeruleilacunae]|nr:TonB-dependent receptor [Puteibacter caeruleilacunae]